MQRTTYLIAILIVATLAACKKQKTEPAATPGSGTATAPVVIDAAEGSAGSGSATGSAAAAGPQTLGEGYATPEAAYYDAGRDMYVVSNINGEPAGADDNGFLMVVNPDGSNERAAAQWKWIDGSAPDIKLDAPKGMAISGDTLYVSDITVVRRFHAKDGKQQDDIEIAGATFLNDVAADGAGGVFVTDTGVNAKFEPTGTDAVYHIAKDGKVTTRIKNKDLGRPNGVWPGDKGSVWVVTFGSNEIFEVDAKGKKGTAHELPKGKLDGVVALDGGDLLVSSWECSCIYRGKPGGEWKEVVTGVESPADIGYDPKRKRLLVPQFTQNKLAVYPLE
jgi:sugar lactone lactonase YvrE